MGQSSSTAKCSETLESCHNCETCETEEVFCRNYQNGLVSRYHNDISSQSNKNEDRLKTLHEAYIKLDADETENRNKTNAASTNAQIIDNKEKFWTAVHSFATDCRAKLLVCKQEEATVSHELKEYNKKFKDADKISWFMSSETDTQLISHGNKYSVCMEQQGLWNNIWDEKTNQLKSEFLSAHQSCIANLPTDNVGNDKSTECGNDSHDPDLEFLHHR